MEEAPVAPHPHPRSDQAGDRERGAAGPLGHPREPAEERGASVLFGESEGLVHAYLGIFWLLISIYMYLLANFERPVLGCIDSKFCR